MDVKGNSFYNNKALNYSDFEFSGLGGAIYYTCIRYLCNVYMGNGNSFDGNYAANSGGALKWDDLEPIFDNSN